MDTKKVLIGTAAGTITSFIAGFLIFGFALKDWMTENLASKEPPEFHWVIISHVLFAFLVTYIFIKWAGISTLTAGLKAGALIGFFVCLGYNFVNLGSTELFTGGISAAIIDALGGTIIWAAGGAGVGWALGKSN